MPFDEARESDGKYMYICSKEYDLFWRCHHKCRIMKKAKATTFSQLTHLLLRLFEYRADKRITINQIQRHPWFKSVRGYNGDEFLRKHFESTMKNIQFQLVTQQLSLQVQLSKNKTNSQQPQSHLSSIQPSVGQQSTATNFKFSTLTYVFQLALYVHIIYICLNILLLSNIYTITIVIVSVVLFQYIKYLLHWLYQW